MIEHIFLGAIQGIAEWLPVSSEGIITLLKVHLFGEESVFDIVKVALFLHLGTALAAIVYFRKDIYDLTIDAFHYTEASEKNKKTITFLILTTLISGVVGLLLLQLVPETALSEESARILTGIVGVLLLVTAWLQLRDTGNPGTRVPESITRTDSLVLGLAQASAALPGLSRSGLTVAALLLLGFTKQESLRLSFLMSIPIVLAGNVVLNIDKISSLSTSAIAGLIASFVFGLLTIDLLLRVAKKIQFGYFVLLFAVLTLIATLI